MTASGKEKVSPATGRLAHEATVSLEPSPEQLTLRKAFTQSRWREVVSQEERKRLRLQGQMTGRERASVGY